MPAAMPRPFRVPDDLYARSLARARADGVTLTSVVVAALEQFVAVPQPSPQPDDLSSECHRGEHDSCTGVPTTTTMPRHAP